MVALSPDLVRAVRKLAASGKTRAEVAIELSLTYDRVKHIGRTRNIAFKPAPNHTKRGNGITSRLNLRRKPRISKPTILLKCMSCHRPFNSVDRCRNRLCTGCNERSRTLTMWD